MDEKGQKELRNLRESVGKEPVEKVKEVEEVEEEPEVEEESEEVPKKKVKKKWG